MAGTHLVETDLAVGDLEDGVAELLVLLDGLVGILTLVGQLHAGHRHGEAVGGRNGGREKRGRVRSAKRAERGVFQERFPTAEERGCGDGKSLSESNESGRGKKKDEKEEKSKENWMNERKEVDEEALPGRARPGEKRGKLAIQADQGLPIRLASFKAGIRY